MNRIPIFSFENSNIHVYPWFLILQKQKPLHVGMYIGDYPDGSAVIFYESVYMENLYNQYNSWCFLSHNNKFWFYNSTYCVCLVLFLSYTLYMFYETRDMLHNKFHMELIHLFGFSHFPYNTFCTCSFPGRRNLNILLLGGFTIRASWDELLKMLKVLRQNLLTTTLATLQFQDRSVQIQYSFSENQVYRQYRSVFR